MMPAITMGTTTTGTTRSTDISSTRFPAPHLWTRPPGTAQEDIFFVLDTR